MSGFIAKRLMGDTADESVTQEKMFMEPRRAMMRRPEAAGSV